VEARDCLRRLIAREDLSREETHALFDAIMDGQVEPPLLAALLTALASKGETVSEMVGAAEAMRACVSPVRVPAGAAAIDTCSTGGDGKPTFNVSTTVAIVAAAAGATVAKHGNRSNARVSGSAEGLAALGINVEANVPVLEQCLADCRVAFLYAVRLHPAMKYAAPVRKSLGIRTIFNMVGPLTNPAGVRRQLLGVNRPDRVEPTLAALCALGAERAMVVYGRDGLCDLSVSTTSFVGRWDGQAVTAEELDCRAVGIEPTPLERIFVRDPQESARTIESVLDGQAGPARDIVVLNTAAALWVAGLADDLAAGADLARAAIDGGAAKATLARWRSISNCS